MPANDRIARSPQIVRQILLHLCRSLVWHWIQMIIQFWQEANPISSYERRTFNSQLMIREAFFWRQSGQPNIDNWLPWIASGVFAQNFANPGDGSIQEHDIHIVMIARPVLW